MRAHTKEILWLFSNFLWASVGVGLGWIPALGGGNVISLQKRALIYLESQIQ